MDASLPPSAQKVQAALHALGMECRVVELPDSTRTAVEAAQAAGCLVGQIIKTLVFRGKNSGKALLALASGPNRVDEARLTALAGEPVEKADADFVRQQTGFAIGGVPPLGHPQPLATFIDEDLLAYGEVWAAAGTPHAVFCLPSSELVRMTGGTIVRVKT